MADKFKPPPGDRMLAVLGMDDLTHAERCLMAVLAWHDGDGGCFPGIPSLAYHLSTKHWNVSAHLDQLEKKGRIQRRKTQRKNEYTLFYDNPCSQEIPESRNDNPALKDSLSCSQEIHGPAPKESLKLTGRTGRTRRREEGKTPVYQEENPGERISYEYVEGIGNIPTGIK